jgi:hypothetical protein
MNKTFALAFCFLFTHFLLLAQKHTIFGNIHDIENGEHLIGATILAEGKNVGSSSNNYGFYSLTLPDGQYKISFSFVGYKPISYQINLFSDTTIDVELKSEMTTLNEVIVEAKENSFVFNNQMGSHSLNMKTVKLSPAAVGEVDLIKNLQLLPGIQTANEGTTNLSVRGGSFDQNLFLLDDAPIYNPSHALGFFSTFNPDAISSVKIFKTTFPAEYGGRLSSILDIRMKEGNNQTFTGGGGAGLVGTRLSVEGPIIKDQASFIISGRYSYAGLTANAFGLLGQALNITSLRDFTPNNEINFYDLNAKANFKIKNNHFYISAYNGHDHFYYYAIDNNSSMDWGNGTVTVRWNHIYNSRLFSNTMLIYSKYDYSYILKDDARHFRWSSMLQEMDLKSDFDYFINISNHLKFGISIEKHKYYPGKIEPRDSTSLTKYFGLDSQQSIESSSYVSNEQKIGNRISLSYGLRYSTFFLMGESTVYNFTPDMGVIDSTHYRSGELIKFYNGLEPRFDIRYLLNTKNSIKFSYTYVNQYQHLISNSSVGLPTDVWIPSNKNIRPQYSHQWSLGFYKTAFDNKFDFSTELYYRRLGNIIDYKDNADLFLNKQIETQILKGKGQSYGAEFFLEKKTGKLTGWISYTLSRTTKQINGINSNDPYPVNFDKRHNLAVVLFYKLSKAWDFGSTFKFTSGGYITIPEGSFQYYGASFNYYTARNGYKLPPYHRLDIAFTYKNPKKQLRLWKPEWNFGVYNLYDHKNIFSLFINMAEYDMDTSKAYKMYLYGITPYFSYNFKF